MIFKYKITLSADLGNMLPPVGDMLKHINDEISILGHDEKLLLRSKCIIATITSKHELTRKELSVMGRLFIEELDKSQPAWKVKVESFRRQSGNVQQSASSVS